MSPASNLIVVAPAPAEHFLVKAVAGPLSDISARPVTLHSASTRCSVSEGIST
jgi:hypothetical protein